MIDTTPPFPIPPDSRQATAFRAGQQSVIDMLRMPNEKMLRVVFPYLTPPSDVSLSRLGPALASAIQEKIEKERGVEA